MLRQHSSVPLIVSLAILFACTAPWALFAADDDLEREFHEPVGGLYTQIVSVSSQGVRTLYVSGQVGPGETLEAQSIAAFGSLKSRLEAAGASVDDVVKLTTYVVDWTAEKADAAFAGFYQIYEGNEERLPAHTLVGIQSLYSPAALLEVEAVAVVAAE